MPQVGDDAAECIGDAWACGNQQLRDAELACKRGCVQRAGASERKQHEVARVVPARKRNHADRSGHAVVGNANDRGGDLRAELLDRAFASDDQWDRDQGRRSRREASDEWDEEPRSLRAERDGRAPLGLDRPDPWGSEAQLPSGSSLALLERDETARTAADALKEAEGILCELCARLEDGELWEEARSARDLVREAQALLKSE